MPDLNDSQKVLRNDVGKRIAAALEALVMATKIPTGGVLGQYLKKKSAAAYDAEWADPSSATPLMDGTASSGSSMGLARDDHVHPTDTSREAAGLGLTGASAGDLVRVSAVDANGKPTAWKKAPLCEIKTNPNLLDNWYFRYGEAINNNYTNNNTFPINQRGQRSYSTTNAYSIDRWKLTSGSVSIGQYGITLNGTIVQILENSIGQAVTCTALLSDNTIISPTYDDTTKTLTITATNKTIIAVKLEIGSEQTLVHSENNTWVLNEIPDYAEQLAKCQRFLWVPDSSARYSIYGFGIANSTTSAYFAMYPPVPMAEPADVNKSVLIPGNLNIRSGSDGGIVPSAATIASIGTTTTAIEVTCTVESIVLGAAAFLYKKSYASAPFTFSCEP